jgi:hypothetical protein
MAAAAPWTIIEGGPSGPCTAGARSAGGDGLGR